MNSKIELHGIKFHFGLGFLNELLSGTGLRLDELGGQDDIILMPKIMYYSRLYAAKRSGIEIDFTIDDIFDLIDEKGSVHGAFWNDFKVAFYDSMNKDVPVDDSKKKVIKAKK
jgi:hypothetical protein